GSAIFRELDQTLDDPKRAFVSVAFLEEQTTGRHLSDRDLLGERMQIFPLHSFEWGQCSQQLDADFAWISRHTEMLARQAGGSAAACDARPSTVRSEARSIRLREFPQSRDDDIDATLACVRERTATEGCKACAEDDTRVDEIRVRDDAFTKRSRAFVDEREDETVLEIRGRIGQILRTFDRL